MNVFRYIAGKIRRGSDKSVNSGHMGRISTTIGFVSVVISVAVIVISICVVMGFRSEIRSKASAYMGALALVAPGQTPVNEKYPFTDSLSYLADLDANDAKQLFDSMLANQNREAIVNLLAGFLLDTLKTDDGKELMLSLVENYVSNLKGAEVEKILGAIPDDVRNIVADSAIRVLLSWRITEGASDVLDPDIKNALKEIAKDYLWHITYDEVAAMVAAVEGNNGTDGAMPVLQAQFNKWMGDYVDTVVKRYMMEAYYYCESGTPRDVCSSTTPVCLSAPAVFDSPTETYYYYTATITYSGSGTLLRDNITEIKYVYTPNGYDPDSGTGSAPIENPIPADYYDLISNESGNLLTITADFIDDFFNPVSGGHDSGVEGNQLAIFVTFSNVDCLNGQSKTFQIDIFYGN